MARVSNKTVLLSSEMSEIDTENMEYAEKESDASSSVGDSELEICFGGQKRNKYRYGRY